MRVHLSDDNLRQELMEELNAADCVTLPVGPGACEVLHPFALDAEEAWLEVRFFVRAWRRRYPGVSVEIR